VDEGRWRADVEPGAPYYWRREADFYAARLSLAPGLRAPECHGVVDLPDGAVGVCLADAATAYLPSPWPVETYERVATGAASLAGIDWGGTGWLAAYVARHDATPPPVGAVAALGLARAVAESLVALWHERSALLDLLDALPRALCHHDLSVQNVLPASDPPTVIDCAFAGQGAVGTDVGPLAVESVLDFHLPPRDLDEVATRTHDAYVAALDIAPDDARLGLAAATAVKFAWIVPAVLQATAERPATLNGRPPDEALPVWTATLPHLAAQAATARRLR
jgi:hypothetical protein